MVHSHRLRLVLTAVFRVLSHGASRRAASMRCILVGSPHTVAIDFGAALHPRLRKAGARRHFGGANPRETRLRRAKSALDMRMHRQRNVICP